MDKTLFTLLDVTRHALKEKTYDQKIEDEHAFFYAALENGLIGLIFEFIDPKQVSDVFYQKLKTSYYAYVSSDTLQLNVIKQVSHLLSMHHIDHIFVKGSHLKSLYPKTYMRGMGDIDILVKESVLRTVQQLFLTEKIILESKSDAHDLYKTVEGVTIEIHPRLYKTEEKVYLKSIFDPWTYAKSTHDYAYALDPSYELSYLLYHLSKHIRTSGVGLRSILDIGIFIKAYHKTIDLNILNELLEKAELKTFYERIDFLNHRAFDMKLMTSQTDLSIEKVNDILRFISTSGIHGKGRKYNPFQARIASFNKKHKSRFCFYISILFPSFKKMSGRYPLLKKIPILLPFAWGYRILFKFLFGFKLSFRKSKQVFMKKDIIEHSKTILNDLGL